jgi:uncharacterized protein YbbC (DUF1343 family)
MMRYRALFLAISPLLTACTVTGKRMDPTEELTEAKVKPGITVLVHDSLDLIKNKRIALITNQSGVDERGTSDIDVLTTSKMHASGVTLVRLFSPEHGIRGTASTSRTRPISEPGFRSCRFTRRERSRRRTACSPT